MLKRGNFLKAITLIFAIVICIGKIHGSSNINTFVKSLWIIYLPFEPRQEIKSRRTQKYVTQKLHFRTSSF